MSLILKKHLSMAIQSLQSVFNKKLKESKADWIKESKAYWSQKLKESKAEWIKESKADWNQNDATAPDYIKNRICYTESSKTLLVEKQTVIINENGNAYIPYIANGEYGMSFEVVFDGQTYTGKMTEDADACYFIHFTLDSGEHIEMHEYSDWYFISDSSLAGEHTIEIFGVLENVSKIPDKFIDFPVVSVNGQTGYVTITTSSIGAAPQYAVNDKMNKSTPVGTGSFSMNRKAGSSVGSYSVAEGYNATAKGYASHAEGEYTIAGGYASHAEGYNTTANGSLSHAEGGYTIAGGYASHAQGKYNIGDTTEKYAHIVGNGTTDARSNAHTLDWDGNAWYQGDVYVGSTSGTNKDEGSKKLATEEYVNSKVTEIDTALLSIIGSGEVTS